MSFITTLQGVVDELYQFKRFPARVLGIGEGMAIAAGLILAYDSAMLSLSGTFVCLGAAILMAYIQYKLGVSQ